MINNRMKDIVRTAGRYSPILLGLALSVAANAQSGGTIDTSAFSGAATTLVTAVRLVAAAAAVAALIFSGFKFVGREIMGGIIGVVGAIFCCIVIGYAPTWVSTLTGVSVG